MPIRFADQVADYGGVFLMKFTTASLRGLVEPGKYTDGRGLSLHVISRERRNWVYRFMRAGRSREMGLGSANNVTLAEAREKAADARKLLAQGIDPIDQRQAEQAAAQAQQAARVTFAQAASHFIAAHEAGWRNPKHAQQWRQTLATYAEPFIGNVVVGEIDTNAVLRALTPIWHVKTETASRLRSRIELVLDYATTRGWRSGPNPAIWRGNLKLTLPSPAKVRAVEHHAALDWREMPAFMATLRGRDGLGARALEFLILTGARSGEVRRATWSEFDLDHAVWTVPAARMKAGRVHRVPLSVSALAILRAQAKLRDDTGLVFHGQRHGTPMSEMSMTAVLQRMGRDDVTVHGFRSTFRDWCAEATSCPREIAEAALAHAVGDKTEAAYFRGDVFAKRAALMADWGAYLSQPAAEVVTFRRGGVASGAGAAP